MATKKPLNISQEAAVQMPMKTVASLIIIVFCGTFLTILLISFGLTLKSKILIGLLRIKTGLQKILTKCSTR